MTRYIHSPKIRNNLIDCKTINRIYVLIVIRKTIKPFIWPMFIAFMIRYFVIVVQEFSVLNFVAMDKKHLFSGKCPISPFIYTDCEPV